MRIDILTLFPEMFDNLKMSIIGRALENNLLTINLVNIRDFSKDKHKKCDDYPFGGGAGMLMTPQPLYDAIISVKTDDSEIVYMSPRGETLTSKLVISFAKNIKHLIIICGHYEGIDQRILDIFNIKDISIGDYVLTGGELPAMVLVDSVARYIDGVLSEGSTDEESFSTGLLEYPQYTRPAEFMGHKVPDILISGDHEKVRKWRYDESLKLTKARRPDLIKKD